MTSKAFQLLSHSLSELWRLLTSVTVPGTNFNFATLALFILVAPLILNFLTRLFGVAQPTHFRASKAPNSKSDGGK